MELTRLFALFFCFASGATVPLVTMAAEEETSTSTMADAGFHTSSRNPVFHANASAEELSALRAQLWALTVPGGIENCDAAGTDAPCADTITYSLAD